MTRNSLFKILSVAAVLALLVVACGDDDDDDPTATSPSEGGAPTATRESSDGGGGGDGDPLIAMGEQLYSEQGCSGCHSVDGSDNVGPSWQGIYNSEEELEDGSTVTVDDAYIAESITDPGAKIVSGYQNIMPPYANFTDEQISAVTAYIASLAE